MRSNVEIEIAEGTKLNNVKCVFQVSPVAASDPAAGKKQKETKDIKTKDRFAKRLD
jgi:hypothetical protein